MVEVEGMCRAAERAQERLDVNCSEWQWLWIHQVVYAFAQILVVVVQGDHIVQSETRADSWQRMQRYSDFGVVYPMFHFALGGSVLLTALITPSLTTHFFTLTCRVMLKAMRLRGATITDAELGASFLEFKLRGFTFAEMPIDGEAVAKFLALVGIGSTAWLSMGS